MTFLFSIGSRSCQREGGGEQPARPARPVAHAPPRPPPFVPAADPSNASAALARAHPPVRAGPHATRLWSVYAREGLIFGGATTARRASVRWARRVDGGVCRGVTVYEALHSLPCT